MSETLENEIRTLRAHFWSERDPEGRAFAPLADAYLRKGDLEEAHALLEDGLGRLPGFVSGHLVAARVHRARGDREAFHGTVHRLLELDGENAAGLRLHGEILEEEGRQGEAMECFRRALSLNPEYDDLESRIARLEVGGIPDDRAEPLDPAEPQDPDVPRERRESDGSATDGAAMDGTASEDFEEALHFESSDDLTVDDLPDPEPEPAGVGDPFELAWAGGDEEESDPSRGDMEAEIAGGDDDPSPTVTRTLGELYLRQGLTGRAVEVFEELVRRRSDDLELRERLGEIRARLSESEGEEGGEAFEVEEEPGEAPEVELDAMSDFEPTESAELTETTESHEPTESAELTESTESHETTGPNGPTEGPMPVEREASIDDDEEVLYGSETEPEVDDEDLMTPFAWDEAVDEEGGREIHDAPDPAGHEGPAGRSDDLPSTPVPGRTIGGYLGDLLAWEPGAIPIEALDPAAVPIASLAPEPKRAPAPDGPDDAEDGEAGGGEGDLDDFQDWLRGLRS